MSVLVEGISVIIRCDTLSEKYPGKSQGYIDDAPNSTICADTFLTRVGFMDPADVQAFVATLQGHGLIFMQDGVAVDIAIVDQMQGPTMPVPWMTCRKLTSGEIQITVAVDNRDPNTGNVVMPLGWVYENSLSQQVTFIAAEDVEDRMEFLREENGVKVYRDRITGREQFVGRSRIAGEEK